MGIGRASGEKRAEEAAKMAINSPLLEVSINGAKGVLFSIAGGDDLTMFEIHDAAKFITESVDPNAKIIFGTVKDENLRKGEIKITVIASGFPESYMKKGLFGDREEVSKSKIFNAMPILNNFNNINKEKEPEPLNLKQEEKKETTIEDNDDDWGAVPAFLRRSKLK